jgi:hypothetical protein
MPNEGLPVGIVDVSCFQWKAASRFKKAQTALPFLAEV